MPPNEKSTGVPLTCWWWCVCVWGWGQWILCSISKSLYISVNLCVFVYLLTLYTTFYVGRCAGKCYVHHNLSLHLQPRNSHDKRNNCLRSSSVVLEVIIMYLFNLVNHYPHWIVAMFMSVLEKAIEKNAPTYHPTIEGTLNSVTNWNKDHHWDQ